MSGFVERWLQAAENKHQTLHGTKSGVVRGPRVSEEEWQRLLDSGRISQAQFEFAQIALGRESEETSARRAAARSEFDRAHLAHPDSTWDATKARVQDRMSIIAEAVATTDNPNELVKRFGFDRAKVERWAASQDKRQANLPSLEPAAPFVSHFQSADADSQMRLIWDERSLSPELVFTILKLAIGRLIHRSNLSEASENDAYISNHGMSAVMSKVSEGLELANVLALDSATQCRLVVAIMFSHLGVMYDPQNHAEVSATMFASWANAWTTMTPEIIREIQEAIRYHEIVAWQNQHQDQEILPWESKQFVDSDSAQFREMYSDLLDEAQLAEYLKLHYYRQQLGKRVGSERINQLRMAMLAVGRLGPVALVLNVLENAVNYSEKILAATTLQGEDRSELAEKAGIYALWRGPHATSPQDTRHNRVQLYPKKRSPFVVGEASTSQQVPAIRLTFSTAVSPWLTSLAHNPDKGGELPQSDGRERIFVPRFMYEALRQAGVPWMISTFSQLLVENLEKMIVGFEALFAADSNARELPLIIADEELGLTIECWIRRGLVLEDFLALQDIFWLCSRQVVEENAEQLPDGSFKLNDEIIKANLQSPLMSRLRQLIVDPPLTGSIDLGHEEIFNMPSGTKMRLRVEDRGGSSLQRIIEGQTQLGTDTYSRRLGHLIAEIAARENRNKGQNARMKVD